MRRSIWAGAGPCDVVLKVVFDENEKKYEDPRAAREACEP